MPTNSERDSKVSFLAVSIAANQFTVPLPTGKEIVKAVNDRRRLRKAASEICDILEIVDNRCMAADGPVTPTLQEITAEELRRLYKAANRIRR